MEGIKYQSLRHEYKQDNKKRLIYSPERNQIFSSVNSMAQSYSQMSSWPDVCGFQMLKVSGQILSLNLPLKEIYAGLVIFDQFFNQDNVRVFSYSYI